MSRLSAVLASVFILFIGSLTQAQIELAPPAFDVEGERYVFVDFLRADYEIIFDGATQTARVRTRIEFEQPENGFALFDLKPDPLSVKIDGVATSAHEVSSPDRVTTFRKVAAHLQAGRHVLEIENEYDKALSFTEGGAHSGFWMSDLDDRGFLEQYVPANLEFDQLAMTIDVRFENIEVEQVVLANGTLTQLAPNHWRVEYPEYYTNSSVFFHAYPRTVYTEIPFVFQSADQRQIPGHFYTYRTNNADWTGSTLKILGDLEEVFGPWPHDQVIVHALPHAQWGMEYAAATQTGPGPLRHELIHSYFARGPLRPANGNAGWIDEAITSWWDAGGYLRSNPGYRSSRMAGHSPYERRTDTKAYSQGRNFIAYLAYLFKDQGGFAPVLKKLLEHQQFRPITTPEFQEFLEKELGQSLKEEFDRYIYGTNSPPWWQIFVKPPDRTQEQEEPPAVNFHRSSAAVVCQDIFAS